MRFEVWYKNYVKDLVGGKGYDVVAVNDNAFKVNSLMDKSDKTVLMLVQGGNVIKSNIPNYDLNTMSFVVNFIVPLHLKNGFMSDLCDISENQNASLNSVAETAIRFRGQYNTPYVVGETTEIRHGSGTMKVCHVQWVITLNYGKDAYVFTPSCLLKLNGTIYTVDLLMRFEASYSPAYDTYQPFGSSTQKSVKLSEIRSFVLQVAAQDPNDSFAFAFQKLLYKIAYLGEKVDEDIILYVGKRAGESDAAITINQISVSGAIENNSGSYLITLGV